MTVRESEVALVPFVRLLYIYIVHGLAMLTVVIFKRTKCL